VAMVMETIEDVTSHDILISINLCCGTPLLHREGLEADQRGKDATEDTTGKDILILGDAHEIKAEFYAALMIDWKRFCGSLLRDPKRLLFKVQIMPYNYRSHLMLQCSAIKPHNSDGKAVCSVVKLPCRESKRSRESIC